MKLTTAYLKINGWVEKIERGIAIALISGIVIIVFSGTIARYLFDMPLFGSDRMATYLMVWLGFIGFQIATSKSRHIEVEFLKSKVSPAAKCKMNIFASLLASVFLAIFSVIGFMYVQQSMELGDVDLILSAPMWCIIIVIPISFLISSIRFFFMMFLWVDVLKGNRTEKEFVSKQLI